MPITSGWARFWDYDYSNAFRLYFQGGGEKKAGLVEAFDALPSDRARIAYRADYPDPRLVILFSRNLDNQGARLTEAWMLGVLAMTRGVTFFGTEGATGAFSTIDAFRAYPNRVVTQAISLSQFREHDLSPLEYVALCAKDPIALWGIEDATLYKSALSAYREHSGDYWSLVERRPQVLVRNLVEKIGEVGVSVAGLWLTPYNFQRAHEILMQERVPHVGVWSVDDGPTSWGLNDRLIRGDAGKDKLADAFVRLFEEPRRWLWWLRWFQKQPRTTMRVTISGDPSVIIMRSPSWTHSLLDTAVLKWFAGSVAALIRNIGKQVRSVPRPLSAIAHRMGFETIFDVCDVCGKRFQWPCVAIGRHNQDVVIDVGGYCRSCRRVVCEDHVQLVLCKGRGGFLYGPGCEVCGEVLVGFGTFVRNASCPEMHRSGHACAG